MPIGCCSIIPGVKPLFSWLRPCRTAGDKVLAQAAGAVNDMVDLTHDLRALTNGILGGKGTVGQLMTNRALYDQFVGTMSRANTMLTKLQNPNGTFARLLDDPTLYNRFIGVVTSADSLVVSLNDKNGTIGKLLRDDSLYTHFVSMAQAGDSIMKALSNGQGPIARLLNDPTLYDRLNKLTTDLGTMLEDVRKDPHRYFRGMILKPEPIFECVEKLQAKRTYDEVIYVTADGERLTQQLANELSLRQNLIIICGHYKGIDERVRMKLVTKEISIGDYVLTGGELAALVVIDTVARLIPGVLGDGESLLTDSFQENLLDNPSYTRPAEFKTMRVPEVLLSGDHKAISRWRQEQRQQRTRERRNDLLS